MYKKHPIVGKKVLRKRQNNAVLFDAETHSNTVTTWPTNIFLVHVWECEQTINNLEHTVVYTMQTVNIMLPWCQ